MALGGDVHASEAATPVGMGIDATGVGVLPVVDGHSTPWSSAPARPASRRRTSCASAASTTSCSTPTREPGGAWQHRWSSLSMDDVHGVADLPGSAAPGRLAARGQPRRARLLRRLRARPGPPGACARCGSTASTATATSSWCAPASTRGGRGRSSTPPAPGRGRSCPTTRASRRSRGSRCTPRTTPVPSTSAAGGCSSSAAARRPCSSSASSRPVADTLWVTRRPPVWRDDFDASAGLAAVTAVEERVRRGLPPASVVSVTGLGAAPAGAGGGAARRLRAAADVRADRARRRALGRRRRFERVDAILWATGFRPAVDHLAPLGLRTPRGRHRARAGARQRAGSDDVGASTRACSSSATARRRARSAPRAPGARRRWRCRATSRPRPA